MQRERTGLVLILTLAALCLFAANAFSAKLQTSVVFTDQDDYSPYDSVVIMGSGFWPNESIQVQVTHYDGYPPDGEGHEPWVVEADDEGNFETYWIVPPDDHVDEVLLVTAIGLSSGIVAEVTFTDCNTLLSYTISLPDTACGDATLDVCANLSEACGCYGTAPLAGRMLYFWVNPGNCGVNVGQTPDDSMETDAYGNASASLTLPTGPGTYSIRVKFFGEDKPEWWEPPNSACDPTRRTKLSAANLCEVIEIIPGYGNAPTVDLGNDTTITLCSPAQICLSLSIDDPECDIDSIITNLGGYSGNATDYDQVSRINALGGTVTQVGGGDPGKILYEADDFVSPVNTQSGVSVTLPDFIFADHVTDYGSFPYTSGNSAYYLLGPPTDLTYTLPGAGGPDGGYSDGAVDFSTGNYAKVGFAQAITTCNGAAVDLVIFTNSYGGGTASLLFYYNGLVAYSMEEYLPVQGIGDGIGGLTVDLPDGITFNEIKISAASGSLAIDALGARAFNSPSSEDICFWADTTGVYQVAVAAYDGCGHIGYGAVNVTVNLNNPPVADAGADQTFALCAPSQVCWLASCTDPDGNLSSGTLISGPGTYNGSNICFTPTAAGSYSFVLKALDDCGYQDYDTVTVTITMNQPPVATVPNPVTAFLCSSTELCHDFTAVDPNGGTLIWSHVAGVGSITGGGHFCFTPTASGSYAATVAVSDSCGLADTVSITYNITLNGAPVFADPTSPVELFQCVAAEVCYQFEATDPESGSLTYSKLSGDGTVTAAGYYCFTPTAGGAYGVVVTVTDSCGLADTTSLTYNVEVNEPPVIALAGDTAVDLCTSQAVCIAYDVSDPQGTSGLVEEMLSGYGTIDTAANQICFTPTTSGSYEFIVAVTDGCGEYDYDTAVVLINFGQFAAIDCPSEAIDVFLCAPDQICQTLNITPASAAVNVSFGSYSAGQLCFDADTAGTYDITVIATEDCNADTCQLTFNVDIGAAAQIDCPAPSQKFICAPGSVCIPVGIYGAGATVTVTPIGSYASGNLCFPADTSGHYEITVIAATTCGTDTCQVISDVTINSAPVAVDPTTPVDTFICTSGQICFQFEANDVDDNITGWTRLSGDGTVTNDGLWCINASGSVTKSVTVAVTDACGAVDTTALTYNVTRNSAPIVTLGADETRFMCALGPVCVFYDTSDADDNIVTLEELTGIGTINDEIGQVCFNPTGEGVYRMILQVTDACGAVDLDTVNITVALNEAPYVDAGADQTVFQCEATEICWTVASGDADGNLTSIQMIEGPGTFDGSQVCFTPTGTYNYEFIFKATDVCGLEAVDTVAVYYSLNRAPVANAGPNQTLFQCTPTEVCLPVSCSDPDGNLSDCTLMSGPGYYNGSAVCFTPTESGVYSFVIQATDACGLTDLDTVTATVTINSTPVCVVPNDTSIFLCSSQEVCLPAYGTDVDGNLQVCQIISGPGTLSSGAWCYTPVGHQTVTVTMRCTDACGATCESTFTVDFSVNGAPTVSLGADTTMLVCEAYEMCLPYSVSDPDNGRPLTVSLLSGPGTLDEANSRICFTPSISGIYLFELGVEDECGLTDTDTILVNLTLNSPPVANAGPDQDLFLCEPTQICWPAACGDPDDNLDECLFSGPGSYDGTYICFDADTDGEYQFIMLTEDECGAQDADTAVIKVTMNVAPTLTLTGDTSLFLCAPQQICLDYDVTDPNSGQTVTEVMLSGYGTLDTTANVVCFTPTVSGTYEFVLRATDACGAISQDTTIVTATFDSAPSLTCQPPTDYFMCGPDSVIIPVPVTPTTAVVTTSFGTYANGAVRFYANSEGTYDITVTATTGCGVDTCHLTGNIDFNEAPIASAGSDQTLFLCDAESICWSASCSDVDDNLTACELISPVGTYNGSQICFTPTVDGSYEFVLRATDECGEIDLDTAVTNVTFNSAPTITAQADTSVFLCTPQQICLDYTVTDPDAGQAVTEVLLSGFGTIDTVANTACFTPTVGGVYEFVLRATDACGEISQDTAVVTVTFGEEPTLTCPEPTDYFLCGPDSLIIPITVTPASATVTTDLGTYGAGAVRFLADTEGAYDIMVVATTACGADTCHVTGTIDFNEAPIASAGSDQTLFLCDAESICWSASCSDVDDNLTACELISPVGTYNGSQICFTPTVDGSYEFVLRATDECGEIDLDTAVINVTFNSAPTIT
ncbi:MAG TPA: hypothetical protein PLF13_01350, partial [candidate division Zixibacteria bacterium]|nr:hypothetical protein [candidate division Zixibacteria bacterium]